MMMTKEEAEERKKLIESLLKEGLTEREAAERMGVSEMTVHRNMKKFGLKANGKRQSFKVIGNRVLEDYRKGYKAGEIAKKYGRKEEAVRRFIRRQNKCNKRADNQVSVSRLKRQSDLYKDKLDRVKKGMIVGGNVMYNGKSYIVAGKYGRFAVLQGKEYQITAMYDDFVRQAGSAGNG